MMEVVFVRKLPAFALTAAAAAALAGTAVAAAPNSHVMNVPLPDGSVAQIEYVGNVAPKVTIAPRPMASAAADAWGMPFPSFAGFDRMIDQMQRQSQQMIQQAQQMSRQPNGIAAPYIASYANMPAGQTSTTVVSISNNGSTCTRSTEVVSQGPGKAPKVTSSVSGQCAKAPPSPTHPV
jgi:hypothetical protein